MRGLVGVALSVCATLLFAKGFFLARRHVDQVSTCHEPPLEPDRLSRVPSPEGCWTRRRYDHLVVLLIDALRFDFLEYNHSHALWRLKYPREALLSPSDSFTSHLQSVDRALHHSPRHSSLFRMYSDPPTVTMQRLSALSTGSLPTFLDFASNFASDALKGDTLIGQMSRHEFETTFVGDDTWIRLFPDTFTRAFPYPSFNVKDLHTVDNGCIEQLKPQLKRILDGQATKTVTIAHFLGVDHVGHRYHASHETMRAKLQQLDAELATVIDFVGQMKQRNEHKRKQQAYMCQNENDKCIADVEDGEVLLLVFGDHGMTADGNHGGATPQETLTGLFVHSSSPLSSIETEALLKPVVGKDVVHDEEKIIRLIAQVDLVASVSLLLGLPIPFANLGAVVPELFMAVTNNLQELVQAIEINAYQVWKYLNAYQSLVPGTFESASLKELALLLQKGAVNSTAFDSLNPKEEQTQQYQAIFAYQGMLRQSLELCRAKWATFDVTAMVSGAIFCLISAVICMSFSFSSTLSQPSLSLIHVTLRGALISLSFVGGIACISVLHAQSLSIFSLLLYWLCVIIVISLRPSVLSHLQLILSLLPYYKVVGVQNSMFPNLVAVFSVLGYMQGQFTNSYILFEAHVTYFLACSVMLSLLWSRCNLWAVVTASAALKCIQLFGNNVLPSSTLSTTFFSYLELACITIALFCLPLYLLFLSRHRYSNFQNVVHSFIGPSLFFLCFLYWLLQPPNSIYSTSHRSIETDTVRETLVCWIAWIIRITIPQIVYFSAYCGVPLFWYLVSRNGVASKKADGTNVLQSGLKSLVYSLQKHDFKSSSDDSSAVWSLYTSDTDPTQSTSLDPLSLFALVSPSVMLLLGPKSSVITLSLLVMVHQLPVLDRSNAFAMAAFYFFLSLYLFFAFSHSQTLSALQVSASFVGFDHFHFVPAGILLGVNTFAHLIFLALLLAIACSCQARESSSTVRQQFKDTELSLQLLYLIWSLFALRTACTMLNVTINRRHLMMWEIFAPKFMFDSASLFVIHGLFLMLYANPSILNAK